MHIVTLFFHVLLLLLLVLLLFAKFTSSLLLGARMKSSCWFCPRVLSLSAVDTTAKKKSFVELLLLYFLTWKGGKRQVFGLLHQAGTSCEMLTARRRRRGLECRGHHSRRPTGSTTDRPIFFKRDDSRWQQRWWYLVHTDTPASFNSSGRDRRGSVLGLTERFAAAHPKHRCDY